MSSPQVKRRRTWKKTVAFISDKRKRQRFDVDNVRQLRAKVNEWNVKTKAPIACFVYVNGRVNFITTPGLKELARNKSLQAIISRYICDEGAAGDQRDESGSANGRTVIIPDDFATQNVHGLREIVMDIATCNGKQNAHWGIDSKKPWWWPSSIQYVSPQNNRVKPRPRREDLLTIVQSFVDSRAKIPLNGQEELEEEDEINDEGNEDSVDEGDVPDDAHEDIDNLCGMLDRAALYLHYLWIGPIVVCVSGYLVWREIGISSLAGIGLLLVLAPMQVMIGQLLMKYRRDAVKFTDKRVKMINEIITGIRVIKMYAWEHYFTKIIDELRAKEIHAIRKLSYLRAGFISFFFSSASFVSFITFMTYVLTGNALTAQKVFTCVSLFNVSRLVMTLFFPHSVTLMNEARVSIERIQSLLLMDELQAPNLEKSKPKSGPSSLSVESVDASWSKDAKTLQEINFAVGQGELAAIVGPVGSGKSSLLQAILGELLPDKGSVNVVGKIAYVSQEAWIFNGTLKNNIIFGQELDERRYQKAIQICALEKDIELLPNGDLTLVGERGVSLSGGQKARVNLARAVYFNADIYILDDPLSAVDAHVGRHLFDKCINGYLSNKVRVLVTHQLQYLADADQILVLSQGRTLAKGTYAGLKSTGIDFVNFLKPGDVQSDDFEAETLVRSCSIRNVNIRKLSTLSCDVEARSGNEHRKISQVSVVDPMDIGEDLSFASNGAHFEEFEEKEIQEETKCEGTVTYKSYLNFFGAGYGLFTWCLLMLLFALCQAIFVFADAWLSHWTTQEEKSGKTENRNTNLRIYGALVVSLVILGLMRAVLFFIVILKSSENLHNRMLRSALRAPLRFYDTNSIGRILNRFSKDMSLVDDRFTFIFFDFLQTAFVVTGIVLLVCISNPVVFAIVAPIIGLFFLLRRYHIKTAREVKRIEGLNRSPVFGHLSTTLLGLPVIRAYQMQQKFTDFHNQYQDEHTKSWVTFLGCGAWLAFRLELLSVIFTAFVVFMSIALRDEIGLTSGQVGLMLAYTAHLIGVFQQCVRHSTEVENHMTSVERIIEYTEVDSEAPPKTDMKPPDEWPKRGSIRFDKMTFAHAANLPNALTGVTAHIKSSEKIGICGRTGAGKSSLLATLFRTNEPKGEIIIDGVNVLELGLKDLRSKISIIPQDPVLFSGTMWKNLDPFAHYSDLELWNALQEVQLKEAVEALPGKLSYEIAEFGQNLSVGQRQLVCLARAILKKNKILVIDEATANVDQVTDNFIQTTMREKFKDCTVLTIAHRLNTVMDSDRIMVLDAGRLKEFDEPYNLLRYKNTLLYQLVKQTGQGQSQILLDMARKSFEAKHSKNGQSKSIWRDGIQFIVSIEKGNASGIEKNGKSIPTDNGKS